MGRVLFIRVAALTYDESALSRAWPFLSDLAWPPPPPLADEETPGIFSLPDYKILPPAGSVNSEDSDGETDPPEAEPGETKETNCGQDNFDETAQSAADKDSESEVTVGMPDSPDVSGHENEQGHSLENGLPDNETTPAPVRFANRVKSLFASAVKSIASLRRKRAWTEEEIKRSEEESRKAEEEEVAAAAASLKNQDPQQAEYTGPRGVIELMERLVDLADYGHNLDDDVHEVLKDYSLRFSSLLERMEQALSDWDVKGAHRLTIEIEDTLDEAENAFYY